MRIVTCVLLLACLATSASVVAREPGDPPFGLATPPPMVVTGAEPADPAAEEEYRARQQEAFERYGPMGVVTLGMDQSQVVVLCHTVARGYSAFAAEDTDRDRRTARFAEVWLLEQRLLAPLEQARAELGESGFARAETESNQAMGLLSLMADPEFGPATLSGEPPCEQELMYAWIGGHAARCDQMLDDMGIARVSGEPPAEYLESMAGFRYRGASAAEIFAGTALVPYASAMCRGGAAPDYAGVPLDQRGLDGMSLLDWAIECDDRAAFDALIAAGFDLAATGLGEEPPLVRTASVKRLWFLTRLLDEGVNPDTRGTSRSALMEANTDLVAINYGGDTRAAFDLMRARGATLDFPDFNGSMWYQWSLQETRWDLILQHWDEFGSDPVELVAVLEYYLSGDMNWANKEHEGAALEVKRRLIEQHGVCFPVGRTFEMERDERGFLIQRDCESGGKRP